MSNTHANSEPTVTRSQLKQQTGERGRRMWIAHDGVVYDVTDCPKWRRGMHENLHWPGQDLTDDLADAPHTASVFKHPCIRRVGRLAE